MTLPDYNRHMDIQQEIQLGIIAAFEREEVSFAYPAQQLVLKTSLASELVEGEAPAGDKASG